MASEFVGACGDESPPALKKPRVGVLSTLELENEMEDLLGNLLATVPIPAIGDVSTIAPAVVVWNGVVD